MFFLGVDGGGTKTDFALISRDGVVLARATEGTSNISQVGVDSVRETLQGGVCEVCRAAGATRADIAYGVFGLPGYGESLSHSRALEAMAKDILAHNRYACVNDVEVGWAGSLACRPGIHLVAGTGSIGFGRDARGMTARSSGWSEVFGDEGSAYWLGRKLLGVFSKQADFRLPRSPLYQLLREHFSLDHDLDLIEIVHLRNDRRFIGQLAKVAYQAALCGDAQAIELYSQAAFEHYLIVRALLKQLDLSAATRIPVSYSGGVFAAGDLVLGPLKSYLDPLNAHLQKPRLGPILGACLYALDRSGAGWTEGTIHALEDSWATQLPIDFLAQ